MLQYKRYIGTVDLDAEEDFFYGSVIGTRDVITYEAESAEDLRQAFRDSIDAYLESCEEDGVEPNRPYSGNFRLRLGADLHRRVAIAAEASGISINELVKQQVDKGTLDYA